MTTLNVNTDWQGPQLGPKALKGKKVLVLAADMENAGVSGVALGIEEAGEHLNWEVEVIDGGGDAEQLAELSNKLHTLDADAYVINGFNALDNSEALAQRTAINKPIIGWHSTNHNGPDTDQGIFANITTDAGSVAKLASNWALDHADSQGKQAGVIIITDSSSQFALDKANNMRSALQERGCEPLEFLDIGMGEAELLMTDMVQTMWDKYGERWNYTIAINDLYFDFIEDGFKAAGIPEELYPASVSGGDGSPSAYERIHANNHQKATVAEPLLLQGWQIVDEINRAFDGQQWSGLFTESCVVSGANILSDVSIDEFYDPANKYRDFYLSYWL